MTEDQLIKDTEFKEVDMSYSDSDRQWAAHLDCGSLTVLDRMTGFGHGIRDIETGFRAPNGDFWLASCDFDIRRFPDLTVKEAINKVKEYANSCVPDEKESK